MDHSPDSLLSWVHALFLAIDANFRLTCKVTSSDAGDPGLNHGYAYIVEEKKFKEYLAIFGSLVPDDKSTCNNHDAIKSASVRGGKGHPCAEADQLHYKNRNNGYRRTMKLQVARIVS